MTLGLLGRLGEVVLVESYSARNTMALLDCNPGLTLSETERRRLRESEEDFLSHTGTRRVLDELRIEYVNVTEEVLDGRTVEREIVENAVERRYQPVLREELYSFVPEKLYALRRGTFISLAKFKVFFTMCTKNMFGLIQSMWDKENGLKRIMERRIKTWLKTSLTSTRSTDRSSM